MTAGLRLACAAGALALATGCAYFGARKAPDPLGPGHFLVATPEAGGPVFAESVVLIFSHDEKGGALGVIVNRPTSFPFSEILPGLEPAPSFAIYLGGPVEIDSLRALVRASGEPPESAWLFDDVFLTASEDVLRGAVAAPDAPRRVRAYLGYAGWAAGQLEAEIARGDWYVIDADADTVFAEDPDGVWPALIRDHDALRTQARAERGAHAATGAER